MTEAFAIISLLDTAASLTKTLLKYASSVKNAPKKIEELKLELTNLRHVFQSLVKLVEAEESRGRFTEASTLYHATGVRSMKRLFFLRTYRLTFHLNRI